MKTQNTFAAAFDAFDENKYEKSFGLFQRAIDDDLSSDERIYACSYIGYMYENGLGVSSDYKQAAIWYEKAARLDDVNAQFMLGQILRNNFKDNNNAMYWYKKAASRSYSPALYQLGIAYGLGDITEKDQEKGEYYLQQAAKLGHFLSRAVIAKKSIRGQYGVLGIIRGLIELFILPISAFLAKRANSLDERLR